MLCKMPLFGAARARRAILPAQTERDCAAMQHFGPRIEGKIWCTIWFTSKSISVAIGGYRAGTVSAHNV